MRVRDKCYLNRSNKSCYQPSPSYRIVYDTRENLYGLPSTIKCQQKANRDMKIAKWEQINRSKERGERYNHKNPIAEANMDSVIPNFGRPVKSQPARTLHAQENAEP